MTIDLTELKKARDKVIEASKMPNTIINKVKSEQLGPTDNIWQLYDLYKKILAGLKKAN